MSAEVVLYQIPPSFYSQIARLALVEKGVVYKSKLVVPGPPLFETYAPWYMRLNAGGTVPTLVHGAVTVGDSREVLAYVEEQFDGPSLMPDDDAQHEAAMRWIDHMYAVSIRELSYGAEQFEALGARVNSWRLRRLQMLAQCHPGLRETYEAKLHDIEGFAAQAIDREHVASIRATLRRRLDQLDALLAEQPHIAGEAYSLADLVWTVTLARLLMNRLDPFQERPALDAWYRRMKARPSFARADVWEAMKVSAMLPMVIRKLGLRLLLAAALIAALGYAAWWLVQLL